MAKDLSKKTERKAKSRKKIGTGASGQHYGYSNQEVRFLACLLEAQIGELVILEGADDLLIQRPDGSFRVVEQATSSVVATNPLTDFSPKLWKTLADWMKLCDGGLADPTSATFRFYVAQPFAPGEIAVNMAGAGTKRQAMEEVERAQALLSGEDPSTPINDANAAFFFSKPELAAEIVAGFSIVTAKVEPIEELQREVLRRAGLSERIAPYVVQTLLGFVKNHVQSLIAAGQQAQMLSDEFQNKYRATLKRYDRIGSLPKITDEPEADNVKNVLESSTLCKQLSLVDCEKDELLRAASDYLWASADRVGLIQVGEISEDSLLDFENSLKFTWKHEQKKTNILHKTSSEKEIGWLVYSECMQSSVLVDGRTAQEYFVRGSYHCLSDSKEIGWHPKYKELLAKD